MKINNIPIKFDSHISPYKENDEYDKQGIFNKVSIDAINFIKEVKSILVPFNIKVEYSISIYNDITIQCFHEGKFISTGYVCTETYTPISFAKYIISEFICEEITV